MTQDQTQPGHQEILHRYALSMLKEIVYFLYMSRDMRFPTMWYTMPLTSKGSDQPAHAR